MCVAVHKIYFIIIGYNKKNRKRIAIWQMPYAVQCIDLVYTIKTVISCRNWNNLEGLESSGSQASASLHFTISR
jgi:hypothetical protein